MPASILATKLIVPPRRSDWVVRPRLHKRLDQGALGRLTLVSAPAGFGKTTLIASWLHGLSQHSATKRRTAWLSLEEEDNAPGRFLSYLIAALQTIDRNIGMTAEVYAEAPGAVELDRPMTLLINDLSAISEECLLVLDDYHVIVDPALQTAMAFLIDHLPPHVHLVIATREEPALPLPRLRARGEVVEIRLQDLRLTGDETTEFFKRTMALTLPAEATRALEDRTEGWVAGLQLAALSLRGRTTGSDSDYAAQITEALGGEQRDIIDYLANEVLRQQPPEIRGFLRRTAILDRFNAPLCDAVTGGNESQKMLAHLERANLFLIPLDDRRQWYRYHHLFADFLRAEISESELGALYARATQWHEDHDSTPEAIKYALAGHDYDAAVRLIRRGVEEVTRYGAFNTILSWINSLPNEVVRAHTDLLVHKGWILYIRGEVVTGEAYAALALENLSDRDTNLQRGMLAAFRADLAINRDSPAQAIKHAEEALKYFGDLDSFYHTTVLGHLGHSLRLAGDRPKAMATLREAVAQGRRLGHHHSTLEALGWLARLMHQQGHLREAIALCEEAVLEHRDARGNPLPMVCQVHVPLGMMYYEIDDMHRAFENLTTSMTLWQQMMYYPTILAQRALAKLYFAMGDAEAAWETLSAARIQAAKSESPRRIRLVRGAFAEMQICAGLVAAAAITLGDLPSSPKQRSETENIIVARLALAQGKADEALKLLQQLARPAEQTGRVASLITIDLLQAIAHHQTNSEAALDLVEKAIHLAAREGYRRSFIDEGPVVAALLERCKHVEPSFVKSVLSGFSRGADEEPTAELASAGSTLISPLSKTQMKVLRHVAEGLSNREIATKLAITEGTTKSHLNQIYSKLNVVSRTQAVARARQLKLL